MCSGETKLWQDFAQNKEQKNRIRLINYYSKWAESQAYGWYKKLYVDGVELSDFYQLAKVGLVEAIDKFDYQLGNKFKTFAQYRVRGNILNGIFKYSEKGSWLNKVHQNNSELLNEIIQVNESTSENSLLFLTEVISDFAISEIVTDECIADQEKALTGELYCSNEFETLISKTNKKMLALEEPVKSIMFLHYQQGMSFTHIAELLDLTRGRISQLHKNGLLLLRDTD